MSKYLKTADSNWYKQRIIGILVCVIAAFSILLMRLFFLQVIKGEEYKRLSENNSIRLQNIDPSRGMVFDRGGKLLVDNIFARNLFDHLRSLISYSAQLLVAVGILFT